MAKITKILVDLTVHTDSGKAHRESIKIEGATIRFLVLMERIQSTLLDLITKARE